MNSINNNDAGARIFENLEALSEKELLELSTQIDILQKPSAESALDAFKKDYLPEASEVSLYDLEKEAVRVKRINLKTLLIAAVVVVMIVASSIVSYAAGAASGSKGTENNTAEAEKKSEKEELRTTVEIDGHTKELFVIKPLEDFDRSKYTQSKDLYGQSFTIINKFLYNRAYHYADVDGNLLEFKEYEPDDRQEEAEWSDRVSRKAMELYDAKFIGYVPDPFTATELTDSTFDRYEAEDYYLEFFMGSNYDIVSPTDPFIKNHKKLYAYYDTNFQMETTISICAKCYNAEKDAYQEFITSRTEIGNFDVVFDIPEGWMFVQGKIITENPIIGQNHIILNAFSNKEESPSEFRQKLNEALEKYQKEKEEKNEIIGKIESGLNK